MPDTLAGSPRTRSQLRFTFWAAGLFAASLLLIYHATSWSMVSIWLRSETFAHGFVILPISLWLVWSMRDRLRSIDPEPAPWLAVLMLPIGFGWLLAMLVDVLVIQQLALVALLVVGVSAILGREMTVAMSFPLLFLFLAVPMGQALVEPMMEFTATSTIWLIRQTGLPVYREGLYFMLPSGSWSVVEACSGVRYIIASVTLGLLYAYLTYRSLGRRLLFVLASFIVPVFANTLRAYIIVMLGHLSDMKVATGVDHLIYGWFFFGLVMFVLFWLGSFFREDNLESADAGQVKAGDQPSGVGANARPLATALFALAIAAAWLWTGNSVESRLATGQGAAPAPPESVGAWSSVDQPPWQWQPESAVAGQAAAFYRREGRTMGLYVQYPGGADTGDDVVGSSSRFAKKGSGARVTGRARVDLQLADHPVLADQAEVAETGGQLLAWSWYRIGDVYTSNDYLAKFLEARGALGWGHTGSYRIVLVVPLEDSLESAQVEMRDFLREYGVSLDEALDHATAGKR